MFGTKVVFGVGVLCGGIYIRLNQIQEGAASDLEKFRMNIGLSLEYVI